MKKPRTILEDYCESLGIEIIDDHLNRNKTLEYMQSFKKFYLKYSKIQSKQKINLTNLNQTNDSEMRKAALFKRRKIKIDIKISEM